MSQRKEEYRKMLRKQLAEKVAKRIADACVPTPSQEQVSLWERIVLEELYNIGEYI